MAERWETPAMQILLGMILGALITVGAAFVYDSGTLIPQQMA